MSQFSIHDSREFADAADTYAASLKVIDSPRNGLRLAFAEGVAHALRLSVGDIRVGDDETLAAIAKKYKVDKAPALKVAHDLLWDAPDGRHDPIDPQDVNPEYVRAIVEMVCGLLGISTDQADEVREMIRQAHR